MAYVDPHHLEILRTILGCLTREESIEDLRALRIAGEGDKEIGMPHPSDNCHRILVERGHLPRAACKICGQDCTFTNVGKLGPAKDGILQPVVYVGPVLPLVILDELEAILFGLGPGVNNVVLKQSGPVVDGQDEWWTFVKLVGIEL